MWKEDLLNQVEKIKKIIKSGNNNNYIGNNKDELKFKKKKLVNVTIGLLDDKLSGNLNKNFIRNSITNLINHYKFEIENISKLQLIDYLTKEYLEYNINTHYDKINPTKNMLFFDESNIKSFREA